MKFVRRHLVIRTMELRDVEDYYYEYPKLSAEERLERIKKMKEELPSIKNDISSSIILVAEEKDTGRMIGTIYGKRLGETEDVQVSIPSASKVLKYSYEVVDQFIKICKENWPEIRGIKLKRSRSTEKYFKEVGNNSEYISLV